MRAPLAVLLVLLAAQPAAAQTPGDFRYEAFVNTELERYLRLLQTTGLVGAYPWSIRSFSPAELERLRPRAPHPWVERYAFSPERTEPASVSLAWIRPSAQVFYNSAFPHGPNLGPVWAGRGLTAALQTGAALRIGALSLAAAPLFFVAENRPFELMPTGQEGRLAYADGRQFADNLSPFRIDLPQRFGEDTYSRLDPGQSWVRVDLPFITAGVSTANQHWGPATQHPIVLGNNAPGFLHGFVGTGSPIDLWLARLHGRLMWGRLEQSEYSPMGRGRLQRFTSGLVITLLPRGVPGLELGLSRIVHEEWPAGGPSWEHLWKPLEGFFKAGLAGGGTDGSDPDNQLASAFFRWALPRAGFEVYGEFGRYDHSWDFRDFVLEPDHDSAYLLGLRKAWQLSGPRLFVLGGEVLNTMAGHLHQVRTPQVPFYVHSRLRQGHTHHGQALGSAAGYGGGGSSIAADYYHPGGRLSLAWNRELRQERGTYWWEQDPAELAPEAIDVVHLLGIEALVFRGRWDIRTAVTAGYNFNRDYARDVFNLNSVLEFRFAP